MSYDAERFKRIMKEIEYLIEEAHDIVPNGSHSSSLSYSTWYSKIKEAIYDEEENDYDMTKTYKQLLDTPEWFYFKRTYYEKLKIYSFII